MHPRTSEILTYLDERRAHLEAAFAAVPPPLRDQSPGAGRWSAAGVIEHVAVVEGSLARRLRQEITQARIEGLGAEEDTSPVLPTLAVSIERVLDRSTPLEAPSSTRPTGLNADAAWAALEHAGTAVREALTLGDGLALGRRLMPHRILGLMPLYYYFAFVGAHEARHAIQISRRE